ncbi:hypothetical protein MKX08_010640 [Trichoderma sp. CBMAI-0020]|nr:hypothetical protein MKX08_010640 [Trichoderma sp. CBMAI-0020]
MDKHIHVHPQCGACGFTFDEFEPVVALHQEGDDAITIASSMLKYRHAAHCEDESALGKAYCRYPNCKACASSVPTITVHKECFDFLKRLTTAQDKLSWLWTAATWKSPWDGAPPLQQALSPIIDPGQFIHQAARACEMPSLSSLPKELALMIYEQSDQSCLHRCLAFWSYARWWNRLHPKMTKMIPIEEIEEWHRGSHPVVNKGARHGEVESDVQKPIIILSIDSQGLRSITRVQKDYASSYTNANDNLSQTDTVAYVVEAAECLASAQVEYNYPFARLQLTGRPEQIRVWDTPSPPPWQECVLDTDYDSTARAKSHLLTIDTRSITGITFFTCFARIWAIHAHTKKRPSAQPTFDTLSPKIKAFVHWLHVPLGSEDTITAFGWSDSDFNARFYVSDSILVSSPILSCSASLTRKQLSLKLAGNIIGGSTYRMDGEDVQLIQHPTTLIYQRPDSEGVHFVGGHAGSTEEQKDAKAEPTFTFRYRKQPFRSASFSSAPLHNVIRAQVYIGRRFSTSMCRGVMLEYANGSKRALGECKVGIDRIEDCFEPTHFCYNSVLKNNVQVKVCNASSHPTHEENDNWKCCLMKGVMDFWFSEREVEIIWKQ